VQYSRRTITYLGGVYSVQHLSMLPFRDRAFLHLDSVDSTNNYAANLLKVTSPPDGTVITAQEQTQGRGQRGSEWQSAKGENLLFSMLLYSGNRKQHATFWLSKCVSVSLAEMLEEELKVDVWIKWPNDILVGGKKIAGTLLEFNWSEHQWTSAIIGIGLNVNQRFFPYPQATSLRQISGKSWSTQLLLEKYIAHFDANFLFLQQGKWEELDTRYKLKLFNWKKWSTYLVRGERTEAQITDVTAEGLLCLQLRDESRVFCDLKEIQWIYE
jgi:BirA family transcriptional regulator, biotin operon repressor / biotin---[acetyl-CoA-carboxylase] ligase